MRPDPPSPRPRRRGRLRRGADALALAYAGWLALALWLSGRGPVAGEGMDDTDAAFLGCRQAFDWGWQVTCPRSLTGAMIETLVESLNLVIVTLGAALDAVASLGASLVAGPNAGAMAVAALFGAMQGALLLRAALILARRVLRLLRRLRRGPGTP